MIESCVSAKKGKRFVVLRVFQALPWRSQCSPRLTLNLGWLSFHLKAWNCGTHQPTVEEGGATDAIWGSLFSRQGWMCGPWPLLSRFWSVERFLFSLFFFFILPQTWHPEQNGEGKRERPSRYSSLRLLSGNTKELGMGGWCKPWDAISSTVFFSISLEKW